MASAFRASYRITGAYEGTDGMSASPRGIRAMSDADVVRTYGPTSIPSSATSSTRRDRYDNRMGKENTFVTAIARSRALDYYRRLKKQR